MPSTDPEILRRWSATRYRRDKEIYANVLIRIPREDHAQIKTMARRRRQSIRSLIAEFIEWGMENADA